MKNKRILATAVIIGAVSEVIAIIYTIAERGTASVGGEYFVLPLCLMGAYIVIEILHSVGSKKRDKKRLTRRNTRGKAMLEAHAFPEYAEETLVREVNAFSPLGTVVEKLCAYEEYEEGKS